MKTKTTHTKKMQEKSLTNALLKGALVWGPFYSIASSTAAYGLSLGLNGSAPAYAELVTNSLGLFTLMGMLASITRWKLLNTKRKTRNERRSINRRNRTNRFSPGSHSFRWSPMHT